MFFSKAILIVISIGAISVLATPHALSHGLHHRAIAARVAPNNNTTLFKRQQSPRCKHHSTSSQIPPPSSISSVPPVTISQPVDAVTPATSSSTQPATPTTTTQPNSNEPSFMHGTQFGELTYYEPGLGACGITNSASDPIAALSEKLFDNYPGYNGVNPNTNPVCNKQIRLTYEGKSVTVIVVDRCTGCKDTDVDTTKPMFAQLADVSLGRLFTLEWEWVS